MRPILRGKYLEERQRQSPDKAADLIRCPACGGWIDVGDLGAVVDHASRSIRQRSMRLNIGDDFTIRELRYRPFSPE